MAIKIYQASTLTYRKENKLTALIASLPASLQVRANRYQNEVAAYNFVAGRLLLKQGLAEHGLDDDLEKIKYQENGKPYVDGIHFNISHSGDRVVCCFSNDGPVGVDLEEIKVVDFGDFATMFTRKEWAVIRGAEDSLRQFYWYWVRKESVIKALGLRLGDLHGIELDVGLDYFLVDGVKWYLEGVEVGGGFLGAVCSRGAAT